MVEEVRVMSKRKQKHVCCICGKKFEGYGNNAWPLKEEGRCCDKCNELVILQRLVDLYDTKEK